MGLVTKCYSDECLFEKFCSGRRAAIGERADESGESQTPT
jgi:hypothetical protein